MAAALWCWFPLLDTKSAVDIEADTGQESRFLRGEEKASARHAAGGGAPAHRYALNDRGFEPLGSLSMPLAFFVEAGRGRNGIRTVHAHSRAEGRTV